jgi:4-hydroxy-tetrahydrodipicolinate synthase
MRIPFTGAGTALITPFARNGDVDEAAVRRLGRRQIDAGIHFLAPCGTTGENPTLTRAERIRIVEILAEEADGRVPILAGAGGYNTREVVELVGDLAAAGASGFLSVTPYYNKPTQEGLYQHYRTIAEATALPLVVYNVPSRTGVNVEVATLLRLAAVPNIVGVKEASGSMQQLCEVVRAVPSGFIVLSGDDAMALPVMAIGGHGVISVLSNEVPGDVALMIEAAERSDFQAARALHHRLMPLMLANFIEANPGPVKAAMAAMGLVEETYRLPLVPPKVESKEKIVGTLKELRLLKGAYA